MLVSVFQFVFIGTVIGASIASSSPAVKSWLTQADPANGEAIFVLLPSDVKELKNGAVDKSAATTISINPQSMLQRMEGFGAGLPQGSAYVLNQLKLTNNAFYNQVMQKLFSKENGIGMSMLRFPIGSCDFSLRNTSYDEVKDDYDLTYFAIDPDSEYIVSVLTDAKAINPELQIIASPWSAPSWLKKYGTLIPYSNDNTLIDEEKVYDTYARYFLDVVKVFRARGLAIDYITLQNEPLFGDSREYPGMFVSSDNARRLAQSIRKYFTQETVQILAYDHNWDHPEYPIGAIQSNTDPVFDGIAWHCYGGDMATAHETAHRVLPDKAQHVTECTGSFPDDTCDITKGMTGFGYNHEWDMSNILLGATSHWAVSGIKWILALDEHCGPTLPDVSYKNGRPLVSIPSTVTSESDIKYNQDYWSIGHMSRFIPRGSYRIASSITGAGKTTLISETFVDAKTGKMSMLVLNSDHSNGVDIAVSINHQTLFTDELPPFSTKVYQWDM